MASRPASTAALTCRFVPATILLPESTHSPTCSPASLPREARYLRPSSTPVAIAFRVSRPDLGAKRIATAAPTPKPARNQPIVSLRLPDIFFLSNSQSFVHRHQRLTADHLARLSQTAHTGRTAAVAEPWPVFYWAAD